MISIRTPAVLALLAILAGCASNDAATPSAKRPLAPLPDVVDAASLHLQPPPAYCAFDRRQQGDALLLDLFDKAFHDIAQPLAMWGDCDMIGAFHAGKVELTKPFILVNAMRNHGRPIPATMSRADFLDRMASAADAISRNQKLGDAVTSDAQHRFDESIGALAKSLGQTATLADRKYLGVQGRDANAVYIGVLSTTRTQNQERHMATILGVTEIGGHIIAISVVADVSGGLTLDQLLALGKQVANRFVANNPDAGGSAI